MSPSVLFDFFFHNESVYVLSAEGGKQSLRCRWTTSRGFFAHVRLSARYSADVLRLVQKIGHTAAMSAVARPNYPWMRNFGHGRSSVGRTAVFLHRDAMTVRRQAQNGAAVKP